MLLKYRERVTDTMECGRIICINANAARAMQNGNGGTRNNVCTETKRNTHATKHDNFTTKLFTEMYRWNGMTVEAPVGILHLKPTGQEGMNVPKVWLGQGGKG